MHNDVFGTDVRDAATRGRAGNRWEASPVIESASGVAELGTILGIWAHPDDEAYLSGGLMAMARDLGSRVVCVTATRGELGTTDPGSWPPDRLAAVRAEELVRSLQILGVTEHHWLGYRDGECAAVRTSDAVELLCEVIERVRPDTVLTFGPDGITGHPDHRAVSTWATAAFERAAAAGARLLYAAVPDHWVARWKEFDDSLGVYLPGYPITTPDDRLAVDLALDRETVTRKVRALVAQTTQTAGLIAHVGVDRYAEWVGEESFAEGLPDSTAAGEPASQS
jgi:LmbE family N-acetylglucosaminyl deacetylase